MSEKISKAINIFYYLLFALVPIILWPKTSEVFEFNKMVAVYILTILIMAAWLYGCIVNKRFIFRHTILDIPLLIFLGSQILSTVFSMDFRTSVFGYYSRFNGGLLSLISYSLLYWAYVSNMNARNTLYAICVMLASAFLVSFYGTAEHFGIDKNVWVQDVQTRVFSTLGQPNWLATWVTALIPIIWAFGLNSKLQFKNKKFLLWLGLSLIFFITLLFTKSRSGILGFVVAEVVFWCLTLLKYRKEFIKEFLIFNLSFLILTLVIGSPWTPNLTGVFRPQSTTNNSQPSLGSSLETGGTESGTIRKIVWKGAIEVWKHYPIFGTGPETFAFSYYLYRPVEHNLVSEWDFLYNKAHNEYLNYLANTGIVGLGSYLVLIVFSIYQMSPFKTQNSKVKTITKSLKSEKFLDISSNFESSVLSFALLSGYASILVSNFFGFSVVPIQIEFFLFPAIVVALEQENKRVEEYKPIKTSSTQIIIILFCCSLALLLLYSTAKYWYADLLYAKGSLLNQAGRYVEAQQNLKTAIDFSPNEAIFHGEISQSYTGIALSLDASKDQARSLSFINAAISESNIATSLSPANLNIKRNQASMYIKLAVIEPKYLVNANRVLAEAVKSAPTEAKLFYNLGLTYARIGEIDNAITTLQKTVDLKPNYRDARFALALVLIEKKETQLAQVQLKYILEKINPNDSAVKNQLNEISK